MRRALVIFVSLMAAAAIAAARRRFRTAAAGRVVDRIVARIEGDIILQSQVRELAAFQQLVEGHAESDDACSSELIEQWVVQTEANGIAFSAARAIGSGPRNCSAHLAVPKPRSLSPN